MSSMLEQAVVDAKALKEAAIKNAEAEIIQKYSGEVKEAVDKLLEGPDDEMADDELTLSLGDEDLPAEEDPMSKQLSMAATDGEEL